MVLFITALLTLSVTIVGVGGATPAATQSSVHSGEGQFRQGGFDCREELLDIRAAVTHQNNQHDDHEYDFPEADPLFTLPSRVSQCHDCGESSDGAVWVMEGEAGWLPCPLVSHPTVYNYSSAQAAGLNLVWYHVAAGQNLEQPIDFHHPDQRLSKERERLWLQPTTMQDTGQYICMLRNRTLCAKISVRLEVVPRDQDPNCEVKAALPPTLVIAPIQECRTLTCPDLEDIKLPNSSYSVTWYHYLCSHQVVTARTGGNCGTRKQECHAFRNIDRVLKGDKLVIHDMLEHYQGLYHCVVTYETKGRAINFTRVVNVTAVSPSGLPKKPIILNPAKEQLYPVKHGSEVNLTCRVSLPYLEGPRKTWWTIDGKTVELLADRRISNTSRVVLDHLGDWIVENVLRIQDFRSEDLTREFNCSGSNNRGLATRRAVLEAEVYLPSVELGCGLGVTLFLMLVLFVAYNIFWLELLLLYRSWFGTDERCTDDKEYDIYISYVRNSEEEQFVLLTLRRVLENELGYTVCIYDRDSLPGGTITDETLTFVGRSRRLLVVLSPGYGLQGTQALLELKAGLDSMAWGEHLRVILVQYKPLRWKGWVRELRRARVALVLVCWQGDKSSDLSSRFWKRLRVELPVRRIKRTATEPI